MKFIFGMLIALALTSCAGTPTPAPTAQSALVAAEKVLTVAHKTYDATGTVLQAAAVAGVLKGKDAATAKVFYDKAGDALIVADTADKAANAQGITDAIALAQDAIGKATALVK